jgi:glycerophosphoryl diester phosphodiesterase
MAVFRRWAQQPAFRRTWQKSEATYAERFRNFYDDKLRGRVIAFPRMFIASHRGIGAGGHPENTVDAFKGVVSKGASVIELDVRKLRDGTLVLWHDDDAGGTPVEQMTVDDLRGHASHLVTFADCLEQLRGYVQLDIELKVPDIEADVIELLNVTNWRRKDLVITSSNKDVLAAVRRRDPKIRTGLIVGNTDDYTNSVVGFIELRVDFLAPERGCLIDEHGELNHEALDAAIEQRIPLLPWSINDHEELKKLLGHPAITGVITDQVEEAVTVKDWLLGIAR